MAKKKHGLMWWLFVSWWVWIFALPRWIIKKCNKKKSPNGGVQVYEYMSDEAKQIMAIDDKYRKVTTRHFDLQNKIGVTYTVINNVGPLFSPEMEMCIQLCKDDIAIAPTIANYYKETAAAYHSEFHLPRYESFKRLAIIFEKRKQYDLAIDVCDQAIALGFVDDGSAGSMFGRKARLMKLRSKSTTKIGE